MSNIFDGSKEGWAVALLENANIGEWLRESEENIVFKIIQMIDGQETDKYFLSNLDNLERDLSKIYFACTNENGRGTLLNETYIKLSNIGLDHFLLSYNDNLWQFFYPGANADINSEYSFGDQSIRQSLSRRCFYLKTNNNEVSISTSFITIPSETYNNYLNSSRIPFTNRNCSVMDKYILVTEVERGRYKNNLNEESTGDQSISTVTSKSYDWLPRNLPDVSEENNDSDVSALSTPERGGRTRHKQKKLRKKGTKKINFKNKTSKLKKLKILKKNKSKSNKNIKHKHKKLSYN
jgi:hypothetical protein